METVHLSQHVDSALWRFAHVNTKVSLTRKLNYLRDIVIQEKWWGEDSPPDNLLNYLVHTFERITYECNATDDEKEKQKKIAISESGKHACINTGLFTKNYLPIFMFFRKNDEEGKSPWFFEGFYTDIQLKRLENFPSLPERANYISNPAALIYDYHFPIAPDLSHILDERSDRIPQGIRDKYEPETLRQLFPGAVQDTEKKLACNFHIAVPQYYNNEIQLLVPIDLGNKGKADIALALSKEKDCYFARTCLTLEQAYQNARVIVKPESDWLCPKQS